MPLSDHQVKHAKVKAKPWRIADGDGLSLAIPTAGSKWWRFDYRFLGRRRTISFGTYPEITLADARARRLEARRLVKLGQDPSVARRREKVAARHANASTVGAVAEEWIAKRREAKAPATVAKYEIIRRIHLKPIAARPIADVDPADLLDSVLAPIERRGTIDMAHRVREVCGQIWRYALATGRVRRDITADLRGALAPVKAAHHPAITDPEGIGALLRALDGYRGYRPLELGMQLLPITFVRSVELRLAEWTEIDESRQLWTVPAARTKLRRDHLVPLSRQALACLEALRRVSGAGRLMFPNPRSTERPISENAFNSVLRQLGYAQDVMTAHGFRAMARTHLDERMHERIELIEVQLAHAVPGILGDTYNRARYLSERAAMMQRWADELDRLKATQS